MSDYSSLKDSLNSHKPICLSPMDGITDEPFRLVQAKISKPDITFTEFVSAEGISHGGVKLYDQLLFSQIERPIVGQLFGKDPDSFYKSAIILTHLGFDGIDINMGCPAKTVIDNGSGAALINTPDLAVQIIQSVKQAVADYTSGKTSINDIGLNQKTLAIIDRNLKYSSVNDSTPRQPTVSVKTRLGVSSPSVDTWIPVLLNQHPDFISIHGRTLKQAYSGQADWNLIKTVVDMAQGSGVKIFGNGDLQSRSQAQEYIDKYHIDGALIGRACMGNPWVFADHKATPQEKYDAMIYHAQLSTEIFPQRRFDPLRKHFLLYAGGLPNASKLRSKLVRISNLSELQSIESDFVSPQE